MVRVLPLTTRVVLACSVWLAAESVRAQDLCRLEQRPTLDAYLNDALPAVAMMQTGHWAVVEAFPGIAVDDPIALAAEPGANRLYVASRQGQIFGFVNDRAASNRFEFLNLTNVTQGWDDCGLMGFAFHPRFGSAAGEKRFVYVWYRYSPSPVPGPRRPPANTPGYNRLSRFTVPRDAHVADRSSELVLINQYDRHVWHDGGGMFFGRDGFLYLGTGDEGSAFDSFQNSQSITGRLFGGVLRIDVDQDPRRSHPIRRQPLQVTNLPAGFTENSYTSNYFIPNDNPFLDPEGGVLEEFWAIGLRNPHRMTEDPVTGRIWEGDIGQNIWEEVNIIERGGNYEWAYREGFHGITNNGVARAKPPAEEYLGVEKPPLYEYVHGMEGKCVIGGYVYRGAEFAKELGGKYIFGDNGSGRLWSLAWDGTNQPVVEYLCNMPPGGNYTGLSSFGVDHANELYILKMGRPSKIYKLARAEKRPVNYTFGAPERLSALRAFVNLSTLEPAPGLIPYEVNSPLWSDGAIKRRWMALPWDGHSRRQNSTDQIRFSPRNEWVFPPGTVFIKHFELPVDEVAGTIRRLETRFLVRDEQGGVYGITYKWRPNGRDAELVSQGLTEQIPIFTAAGVRTQTWFYPGPSDCLVCHTPIAGHVLGVNARQINRDFTCPDGSTNNQLQTWNRLRLFTRDVSQALTNIPALVKIDDPHAPLETRVRSYLDANCSQCHRPSGVQGYFDARFDTSFAEQGIVNGAVVNPAEIPGAKVVTPGDPAKSLLYVRLTSHGPLQMPPIARNLVDTNAARVVEQWIKTLE